jgi:hypothetical protein
MMRTVAAVPRHKSRELPSAGINLIPARQTPSFTAGKDSAGRVAAQWMPERIRGLSQPLRQPCQPDLDAHGHQ